MTEQRLDERTLWDRVIGQKETATSTLMASPENVTIQEEIFLRYVRRMRLLKARPYLREISLEKRVKALETKIKELEKKDFEFQPTKADHIYERFKEDLEQKHFGKIIAIDVESEKILGIGDSVLGAYQDAIRKTEKRRFTYRKVGRKFVHKL